MPLFLTISLPLTGGVILLPLLIGPVIRLLVQTSVRYRHHWRILILTVVPLYLIVIAILPLLQQEHTYHDSYS
jgi:hypothetical protein